MVELLGFAHDENCEADRAALIAGNLAANKLPDAKDLRQHLASVRTQLPKEMPVRLTDLSRFDDLLDGRA